MALLYTYFCHNDRIMMLKKGGWLILSSRFHSIHFRYSEVTRIDMNTRLLNEESRRDLARSSLEGIEEWVIFD